MKEKQKKNYEEIRDKLIDKELFKYYLGENFENECTNVDDIKNDNEEKKSEDKEENINDFYKNCSLVIVLYSIDE